MKRIYYNNCHKGFTLVEVLITLVVLSITLLSVYSVLNRSITTTSNSVGKLLVIDRGYERILKHTHYPRISLADSEEINGQELRFTYTRESTLIPSVTSVILKVKSDTSVINYEYFERTK